MATSPYYVPRTFLGTTCDAIQAVRALKDVEVLKLHLFLVLSKWDRVWSSGFNEMYKAVREDISGIEMEDHYAELLVRLASTLDRFDPGFKYLRCVDTGTNRIGLCQQ